MISSLIENNYLVVPNFISIEKALSLSLEFKLYCEKNKLLGDSQVENSFSKYNYISFLELLCEKTPDVSKIIGDTVLPTYSYARIYRKDNILLSHVDREECEISLTINLDCDIPWNILIENPKGEEKSITLNPGDAMVYLGRFAKHWREKFEGNYCTQVFLHYVKSRGEYSNLYFDKKNYDQTLNDISNKNVSITEIEKINQSPTLIVQSEEIIPHKSKTPLDEYIQVYYSALSDEICDLILNEYANASEWSESMTGNKNVNKNIRNCDIISISQANVINGNPEIRQKIDNSLFNASGITLKKYVEKFPNCQLKTDSGYDLLRYNEGGYYSLHTDSYSEIPRSVSCSFNLNDDYDGGEFAFFDKEMIIRAPKGSAIVFPSNFMYPHEIMQVNSGTRYSIVTWFI